MPPKAPPPPHPDPLTLDQIYDGVVSTSSTAESRAYHIVALQSVAFHPTVKLFLFEHTSEEGLDGDSLGKAQEGNRIRRETLMKTIAFFLSVRNSPVSRECRWEVVSLIGELCRMDSSPGTGGKGSGTPAPSSLALEEKLNRYAKANLEFLALLPWFSTTLLQMTGAGDDALSSSLSGSAQGTSREAVRQRLRDRQAKRQSGTADVVEDDWKEDDDDVKIVVGDLLKALPTVQDDVDGTKRVVWSSANTEQAHDLMFLDASTSLSHLIPLVSRGSSVICAKCKKMSGVNASAFLRCSACKSVFYCSADCQKAHWGTAHRAPCLAYKELCASILAQYYEMNSRKNKKNSRKGEAKVLVVEVPLEPSLFFETRRYLYDHRDQTFADVNFSDYFLKYTVRGN